jgi:hypothetical protein
MVFKATFNNISVISRSSEACLLSFEGINSHSVQCFDIMVVIIWLLDLQSPMQSVPITIKVASSDPAYGEVFLIQHYVLYNIRHTLFQNLNWLPN